MLNLLECKVKWKMLPFLPKHSKFVDGKLNVLQNRIF